ncbi:HNH endonuclease, partial [Candidatus Saccharibacteria bacterium]|nr:HNH endonuclease [Candidatus Saccharibacteria bacterium]
MTINAMVEILGRSYNSIAMHMRYLGLKRPQHISDKLRAQSYFKKDHTPWNKDKKVGSMSPDTEFKKGNIPPNTKYDGAITIRHNYKRGMAYKHIRISKNNWMMYHVYVWEKHHGPVPKNHIIVFKNRDTLDCRIENLECISLRENARRNWNKKKA